MVRLDALLLALLISAPALYQAFYLGEMPIEKALLRFLVAALACMVALHILRSMYLQFASEALRRRKSDNPAPGAPGAPGQPGSTGAAGSGGVVTATVVDMPPQREAGMPDGARQG